MSVARDLPHDAALPQLAQALDADAMGAVFATALTNPSLTLEGCQLERIKYRPQRNCTLSYRLQVRDIRTGLTHEQRVAARLCSGGASLERANRARAAARLPSLAGPALHHFPALDMVTWWWPNDAKLIAPGVLADAVLLRQSVLPDVVAALSSGCGTLTAHHIEIAQYVPEHRLCARVDLQWQANGKAVSRRVYAKTSREPDGATAHGYLRALQAGAAWRTGRLRTPGAVLRQPQFALHWQEGLPGIALLDLPPQAMARFAAPLGTQLAALHGSAVPTARVVTPQSLRARLAEVSDVLDAILPAARDTLRQTVEGLAAGLDALASMPMATLHGDLHARNLLVDGDTLAFIDLDGLRRAPAVLELGAWIADGIYRALLAQASPQRDSAAWQSLLDAYAEAGGTVPSAPTLAWATAWHLLCQRAWRCVVNLKPGRFAIAQRLVEQACIVAGTRRLEAA